MVGWRYSSTRGAWVHRYSGGRYGPVFIDRDAEITPNESSIDTKLFDTLMAARKPKVVLAADQRDALPQREVVVKRPIIPVEVQLHAAEPPRVVLVDGRPPRRGLDPRKLRSRKGVVVPIKSARSASA